MRLSLLMTSDGSAESALMLLQVPPLVKLATRCEGVQAHLVCR